MQYLNYERDIVVRYGVVLEGWTHPSWVNPSELSTSLEPLRKIVDTLKGGSCKFLKLTRDQWEKRHKEYHAKVDSGEIQPREHKKRSDAGKKRKARDTDDSSDDKDTGGLEQGTRPCENEEAQPASRVPEQEAQPASRAPEKEAQPQGTHQGAQVPHKQRGKGLGSKKSRARADENKDPNSKKRRCTKKSAAIVPDED